MLACSTFLLTALVALTHAVPFPSETNPSAGAGTPTQLAVWQRQDKNYFDRQPANGGSAIAYFVDVDAFPTKYGGLVPITFTDGGVPCTHTLTAVVAEQTSTSSASGGAVVTVTDANLQVYDENFGYDALVRLKEGVPEEPLDETYCQFDGDVAACWLADYDGTTMATEHFNIVSGATSTLSVLPLASATHLTKGYFGEMVSALMSAEKKQTTTSAGAQQTRMARRSAAAPTAVRREVVPTPMYTRRPE